VRVRVKYSRQGLMKFIGHLDMMRYFQKALSRAGIAVAYSEGMSPHMIMSYAFPLGVGMTSDSEYVDVDLVRAVPEEEFLRRMNEQAAEGVRFLAVREIGTGKAERGMSQVARADYTLTPRASLPWPADWPELFRAWIGQDEIRVVRKSKRTEKEIDLKALIYDWSLETPEDGAGVGAQNGVENGVPAGTGDGTQAGAGNGALARPARLRLSVSAGSEENVRPDLVLESFAAAQGFEFQAYYFEINRDEVYGRREDGSFAALIDLGKEIG